MKIISIILLLMSSICADAQTISFNLKGKVATLRPPAKAYLVYRMNEQQVIDSALLKNGYFYFKGKIDEPKHAQLVLSHQGIPLEKIRKDDVFDFYLENGTIEISGTDSISKASVAASVNNQSYKKLQGLLSPVNNQLIKLRREFAAMPDDIQSSKEVEERFYKQNEDLIKEKNEILFDYIRKNPNTMVSLNELQVYANRSENPAQLEKLFDRLNSDIKETPTGRAFKTYLDRIKNTSIGGLAPDFTQPDTSGKAVTLSSFRGKYVLLDFWASWCGPCRSENPNLVQAYAIFHPKGFEILGVSLDQPDGRDRWLKAIHEDKLTWTQVSDLRSWKNQAAIGYGINAIPQNFLLDPSGKIIAKDLRGDELIQKLKEIYPGTN